MSHVARRRSVTTKCPGCGDPTFISVVVRNPETGHKERLCPACAEGAG